MIEVIDHADLSASPRYIGGTQSTEALLLQIPGKNVQVFAPDVDEVLGNIDHHRRAVAAHVAHRRHGGKQKTTRVQPEDKAAQRQLALRQLGVPVLLLGCLPLGRIF